MAKVTEHDSEWTLVTAEDERNWGKTYFRVDDDCVTICDDAFDQPNVEKMVIVSHEQWDQMSAAITITLMRRRLADGRLPEPQRRAAATIVRAYETMERIKAKLDEDAITDSVMAQVLANAARRKKYH